MTVVEDVEAPSFSQLQKRIPSLDGHRAARLEIRFGGAGLLDPTSNDDVSLLEAARLGEQVRVIVVGEVNTKSFRLDRQKDADGELGFVCSLKILAVEAAEIA